MQIVEGGRRRRRRTEKETGRTRITCKSTKVISWMAGKRIDIVFMMWLLVKMEIHDHADGLHVVCGWQG